MDAGTLIREARIRAGLTQAELAQRAGTTQSVVSAYESGRRQPSLPMLTTLVEATGHALTLIIDQPDGSDTRLNGPLGRRMRRLRARLLRTIERYGGSNPQVFGSVARGTEGPDSDVDLLVDLPEDKGLFALMRLQRDLESILHTRVDLVPADALKPTARPRIERDLVPL